MIGDNNGRGRTAHRAAPPVRRKPDESIVTSSHGGGAVSKLMHFFRSRRGQDTVEYALLAAFISVVALAALQGIGPYLGPVYKRVEVAMKRAVGEPAPQGDGRGGGTPDGS